MRYAKKNQYGTEDKSYELRTLTLHFNDFVSNVTFIVF